ncbi:phage tail sheath subtilisin-like domain-containing protein [Clostridium beijerinckii]|uniref:phage tail sheath subtilisin-like domain-containing protein n=1 Tax=Clostridium beijerinckii TaxID=1520 RepID=UPI0003D34FE6
MAGNWSETNKPTLPGFYNRFKTIAENRVTAGTDGVLAMPVKANWGPIKTVTSVADESDLIDKFGSENTAYKLGRLALLGQPKELLLYRLVDGSEKVAEITLKDNGSSPVDVIKIQTKYPTTRKFNITLQTNLIDSTQKDLLLFEDSKQIITIPGLSGKIEDIVSQINSNSENEYLVAEKIKDSTNGLSSIVNQALTGGNDGSENTDNEAYLKAMTAFEGYDIDGFVLDGISDTSLQASAKTWTDNQKENGNDFCLFVGGSVDIDLDEANLNSKKLNSLNVVNIGDALYYDGVLYSAAEVAVYIAALSIGIDLKESVCNKKTIFSKMKTKHSKTERAAALKAGTLVFDEQDGSVVIVDDKNTFTEYTDEKGEVLGYIRAVRFINTVDKDTTLNGVKFEGNTLNNPTGQLSVISALKQYFETFENEGIIDSDFTVEIDKALQATAKNDEFYWKWNANYINVMKKIFGTGYIK